MSVNSIFNVSDKANLMLSSPLNIFRFQLKELLPQTLTGSEENAQSFCSKIVFQLNLLKYHVVEGGI